MRVDFARVNHKTANNIMFNSNVKHNQFAAFQNDSYKQTNPENPTPVASSALAAPIKAAGNSLRTLAAVGGGIAVSGGILAWIMKLRRGRATTQPIDAGLELLKTQYQKLIKQFPMDMAYYKELAQDIGLAVGEEFRLVSIVGKSQFKNLLGKFSPQDFSVGNNMEGAKNLTYRVSLHNHTLASDGKLAVFDFLEQARKFADKIAAKVNDGKPPFTIAITDHDTVEGAKEALRIIAANPKKYKNLRVVLGAEFSLVHAVADDVNVPLNFEMLGYGLNPYSKKLNKYLTELFNARKNTMQSILDETSAKYPGYALNFEQAARFDNKIAKGLTNGILYDLREYTAFKMGAYEFAKASGTKVAAEDIANKYGADFLRASAFNNVDANYVSNYFRGLAEFKEGVGNVNLDPKFFEYISSLRDSYVRNPQKTIASKIATTSERFFQEATSNEVSDVYSIAHPGLISLSSADDYAKGLQEHCKVKQYDWKQHLFERFLEKLTGDSNGKLIGAELNYQSYGKRYDGFQGYVDHIKSRATSSKFNLMGSGGLDCHGNNLFTKANELSPEVLKELIE